MLISICINTYKRPELLGQLLQSINMQEGIAKDLEIEIVVVDNDPAMSAESVVKNITSPKNISINYYAQPEKNICLTRNMAVNNAHGIYILFVDDDEIASPLWVHHLVNTLEQYNADAVFGRIDAIFSSDAPDWIKDGNYFHSNLTKTGEPVGFTRTSNCIVKSNLLKSVPGPFDPSYGLTGGEDSHLFRQLRKKGAKFIFSHEAAVTEFLPGNRTTVNYLTKRAFRTGNSYTRSIIELSEKNKLFTKLNYLIRAFGFGSLSFLMFLLSLPKRKLRTFWIMKTVGNVGHLLAVFGYYYKEYK